MKPHIAEMNPHRTKTVVINGEKAEIDAGIVELIVMLNSIPGISTFTSCQGHFEDDDANFPIGYIMFLDCNERRVIQLLTGIYRQMNKLWNEWRSEHSKRFDKGTHGEMHPFAFFLTMGNGWTMEWGTGMYPLVLKATETVASKMKEGTN